MANLRDLISYADQQEITSAGFSTSPTTPLKYEGSAYKQVQMRTHCAVNRYNYFECFIWRPPAGTTFLKFEIWGGGGSGPGTCCCMWGTPGGSGAYAYKCICSDTDLGGCLYEICVASASCCTPVNRGANGCKSFVVGHGLNNFCAEGGYGGMSICHCHTQMSCLCTMSGAEWHCSENHNKYGAMDCQCCCEVWGNCGFSCFTPGGGIGNYPLFDQDTTGEMYDLIGIGNTFGSCGKTVRYRDAGLNFCYGGLCWNQCNFCAPFFGADGGAHGLPGLLGSPCNHGADNFCMLKQYHPFPGGLINTKGGYLTMRYHDMNQSGENGEHYLHPEYFGWASNGGDEGIPGFGGRAAGSHGGNNCYCGGPGHSGMVRITYG